MHACFGFFWLRDILVWVVLLIAFVTILKLLVPFVLAKLGADGGIVISIINIIVWAIVALTLIYFLFALVSCFAPPMLR